MTAQPFDWDDELPPETEDEVYRALLRALQRKHGFGLFFVQCSTDQGQKIVANLHRDLPKQQIEELYLKEEVTTLYEPIADLWHKQTFDVLVVEGLEASLYAYEDVKRLSGWSSDDIYNYSWKGVPKLLNHLNQQREHLRNDFPVRFVFLVPPFVVDYFIQRAADFLDWRSGLFRFPRPPQEIAQDIERFAGGDYEEYLKLSPSTRIEKILHLKTLQDTSLELEAKATLLFELGLLFAAEQDLNNAILSWEKALEIKPDNDAAWYNRGNAQAALGHYEESIASYDKAIEIKADDHEAWYNRGISLANLGRYEEAIASYEKALEIKPDYHEAWYNRGISLKNLGRYEEAIASYEKAVEIKPDYHDAWYNWGISQDDLGRYEEAIESYEKALAIKSDDHEAWNNRGNSLANLGRYEEAIESYDKAVEIKPDYHEAWNNRGISLKNLGRYEEAIESYDKALEIKPDKHEVWYNKACCFAVQGNVDLAVETLQQAIALNSECQELAKTDSDFDGIRENESFRALIEQ
jgi:tetratricopeptide (TPR) repeat protein